MTKYLHIQSEAPVVDVIQIHFYNLFKIFYRTSAIRLPHAGNARFHGQSALVVSLILLKFIHRWRTCTHKAHIAL